jgi:WD40 repeat protein
VTTREVLGTVTNLNNDWPHAPGTRIAYVYSSETVRVWDTATVKPLATFSSDTGEVWKAVVNLDGTRILTTSDKEPARLWELATGKLLATFAGHTGEAWLGEFSPDGTRIFMVSNDMTARLWDTATGEKLATFTGSTAEVWHADFNLDGTRVITTGRGSSVPLWDVTTGKMLATFGDVDTAQFSPDGKRILLATWSGVNAGLWDSANGKALQKLTGHTGQVICAQFSRDGSRIVTASNDKTARVWDGTTGEQLAAPIFVDAVRVAQFSSDGRRIVTTSSDETVRLWDVLPKGTGPPPDWFPDFLRYLAQMRLNSDGELERLKSADWLALRDQLRGVLRTDAGKETPYLRILSRYVRE